MLSHIFFIQPPIDENLGCFHVLTLVNNAVMNIRFHIYFQISVFMFFRWASQVALVVKNPPANAGDIRDTGSIPGLGRSPGGGHDSTLQYSCQDNPVDRGAWRATVHGVIRSQTRLTN